MPRSVVSRHALIGALATVASCRQVGSVGSILQGAEAGPDAEAFPCGTVPLGPPVAFPDLPRGGRSFYVSPNGDDANDGSSVEAPLRTLQRAADATAPGDTVFAMSGVYEADSGVALDIPRSGTERAWITYRAMPGEHPVIRFGAVAGIRGRGVSYVAIDGFEIEGNSSSVTEAYANAADPDDPTTNSTGIELASDGKGNPAHHLVIRNNVVHHASAAGIGLWGVDHVTIVHNTVYGNSRWSKYAASGISVYAPVDVDMETGQKIAVIGNVVYDNVELVPSAFYTPPRITNGNGIIIVDTLHKEDGRPDLEYRGRTLVAGNVAFHNGGPGIHVTQARGVDVAFNTLFENGRTVSVGQGQLDTNGCDRVLVVGNVLWGHDDQIVSLSTADSDSVVYDHNLYFHYRGTPARSGSNDRSVDPRFRDPACKDFRLLADSPAHDSGPSLDVGLSLGGASTDVLGTTRPSGPAMDLGAYELAP